VVSPSRFSLWRAAENSLPGRVPLVWRLKNMQANFKSKLRKSSHFHEQIDQRIFEAPR
jgi:hypothetical protein